MVLRAVLVFLFASSLAACGAGGASVAPATPGGGDRAPATISFVIRVPSGTSTAARLRRPAYVSPSTQSLTIATSSGTVLVTANLTPQSTGCTAPTATTPLTCTYSVTVPAGTNTFTIALYDRPGATGTKLAVAALPVTAAPSGPTRINLTLSGIVASLALALDPPALPSGTAARSALLLNAPDPDGTSGLNQPKGLALDKNDNLYGASFGSNTVLVYAPGANGAAVPTRTYTGLNQPHGIAIRKAAAASLQVPPTTDVYVTNFGNDSISIFDPTVAGSTPAFIYQGPDTQLSGPTFVTFGD